jgi:hypothetical protein
MPVPKAPVHEDCCPTRVHNDVGAARQSADVEPITDAENAEQRPDLDFRQTTPLRDAGHDQASFFRAKGVHLPDSGCAGLPFHANVCHDRIRVTSGREGLVANKYRMKISRLTVDKLGVKLYDKASAVIAEMISNSYDADATKVVIEAPMGQYLASKAKGKVTDKNFQVRITDNGTGMTPDEMQEFYLIVGKERRNDPKRGGLSKIFKRQVTGRKGVGKLAPFGICKIIEIISSGGAKISGKDENGNTVRGYKTSHVIMNYDDIVDDSDEDYRPNVGKLDDTLAPETATTVILRNFNFRKVPDMDTLARQIAQRFGLPTKDWSVTLRDNTVMPSSAGYEQAIGEFDVETMPNTRINFVGPDKTFRQSADPSKFKVIGADGNPVTDITAGFTYDDQFYPLTGWVAYSKTPYKDDLMAGVRIYCRGKIAAQTTIFGRKAGFTGEHSVRSYLVGELNADWLDEDDDLIQTDRRDILWSDERAAAFQEWGQKIVARLGALGREPMRKTNFERFVEVGKIRERAEKEFPGAEQAKSRDQVLEVAKTLGRSIAPGDLDDSAVIDDFVDLTMLLAPHITLDEMLRSAADDASTPLEAVSKILRTARLAELASFGRIAEDRIRVIEKLEKLKDDKNTDEGEFQRLIEEAPWLINPQWAPVAANSTFTTLRREFEKFYKKNTGKDIYLGDFTASNGPTSCYRAKIPICRSSKSNARTTRSPTTRWIESSSTTSRRKNF